MSPSYCMLTVLKRQRCKPPASQHCCNLVSAFGMRRQVYVAQEHGQPESTRGKVYFLVSGSAVTPGGAGHRYLLLSALLLSLFDLS